ncbi:MAG: TonB-dependent receptor [Bacteroidia bacterium]|nr:TonB-dependent receptor [Bacteroidia bacterium]
MKIKLCAIVLSLFLSTQTFAQIKGVVIDKKDNSALIGASVYWLAANKGTTTDTKGVFEIALPPRLPDTLVISYIGYKTDTLLNLASDKEIVIRLASISTLDEAVVTEKRAAVSFNMIDPFNKTTLGKAELVKAACCNLSESFETNATVDVSYSDAISGSKQIKVLGLDGAYAQITKEMLPGIRGLNTNYGFSHIPGTWVDAIEITKGVGSVENGYESMSGHINIELDKPEKSDRFFVNLFAGDAGRLEANVHAKHKFNDKWSTLLLTHANSTSIKNDFNKDGFLDIPVGYQYNILNRWRYDKPGSILATFGVHALLDNRLGGQTNFDNKAQNDSKTIYGVSINTKQLEGFGKLGIAFANQPYKSIKIMGSSRIYEHDAYYGFKTYKGTEKTSYANFIYQSIIGSSDYKFKAGANILYDDFNETYNDSNFKRTEIVPGAFGEVNYDIQGKTNILFGVRTDYHNLYGLMINPRLHIKYNIFKYTVFRISGGRGMRVANPFIENAATMASSRTVTVLEKLNPEVAWNYGTSITHSFKIGNGNTTILVDFYRTDFENQVIADLYTNYTQLLLYNLNGKSYSNSFQTEIIYEPIKKLELRAAYKYQDVKATYNNVLLTKPLVAKHRVLLNAAYATRFDKWKYDATFKWFGQQSLPSTAELQHGLHTNSISPNYYTVNAQITRAFKKWEIYVGVENVFNEMQHHQIVDAQNPFGNNFDASSIWGPIMGRVLYTGMRFNIK